MITIKNLTEKLIEKKLYGHAMIINEMGVNPKAEATKEFMERVKATGDNIKTALDEWRCENESQFDEEDEDFNNWKGDTLEVQEYFENCYIDNEDLVLWFTQTSEDKE